MISSSIDRSGFRLASVCARDGDQKLEKALDWLPRLQGETNN
jgi:hypothetical protein